MYLPHVFKGSYVNDEDLAQYPEHGEHEMLEPLQPAGELAGEVPVSKDLFQAWLAYGPRHGSCPCAVAILFYAQSLQSEDMRGAVGPDSAWELCCRELTLPDYQASIGTRLLANFVIYLLEGGPVKEAEGER